MAKRLAASATAACVAAMAIATTTDGPVAAETPSAGGILNVLGFSDTDYLDPNISYYSIGYSYLREFSRQLYSYPALDGQTDRAVPDLATDLPTISDDGLTYTISIRPGAMWNTAPARQVTAADVVRGVKTTCNPFQPYGGVLYFESLIAGMRDFCRGFAEVRTTARAMKRYIHNHDIAGVQVGADPLTVVFTLTQRASYFTDLLALPAFSPRPREMLDYVPASALESQHTISDGPYQVNLYQPTKKLVFVRNPAWDPATDLIRKAYVDKLVISMTWAPDEAQQQLEAGDPSADVFLGPMPDAAAADRLNAGDPGVTLGATYSDNPYILFNTRSPNEDKALRHRKVRQAISYALNRSELLAALPGAPAQHRAQTHVLQAGIVGSEDFDLYPHDVAKAQALLQSADVPDLTVKLLYRPSSPIHTQLKGLIRSQLAEAGVTVQFVRATDADFYTKYLQNPNSARRGYWDLSISGFGPDWFHDAAASVIPTLFDSASIPYAGYNFGLLHDATLDDLIDQALVADDSTEPDLWHQADVRVMHDAAIYPIDSPLAATYHASQVHNFVYLPATNTGDFTNMWLDPAASGG